MYSCFSHKIKGSAIVPVFVNAYHYLHEIDLKIAGLFISQYLPCFESKKHMFVAAHIP